MAYSAETLGAIAAGRQAGSYNTAQNQIGLGVNNMPPAVPVPVNQTLIHRGGATQQRGIGSGMFYNPANVTQYAVPAGVSDPGFLPPNAPSVQFVLPVQNPFPQQAQQSQQRGSVADKKGWPQGIRSAVTQILQPFRVWTGGGTQRYGG